MTILKISLVTSTALGLSMSAAMADQNKAYLDQTGATNSALIDQTGGSHNRAGRTGQDVTQAGDNNTLTILQSNDGASNSGNRFGVAANGTNGAVIQTGSQNVLNATQNGNNNQTVNVLQTAPGGLSGPSNVATIKQLRNFGGIGTVEQTSAVSSSAVMNTATLTQQGGNSIKISAVRQEFTGASGDTGNEITIFQNGPTNRVGTATQVGHDNMIDISQSGGRTNVVTNATQNGSGNDAKLHFTGDFNGGVDLGSSTFGLPFAAGSFAEAAGAASASSVQLGTNNNIDFLVTGNQNLFGFDQDGNANSVGTITVTGSRNALGVWQKGDTNRLQLGSVSGDDNDIGVRQEGTNTAQVNLTGTSDFNAVWVDQFGNNTAATINIDGDSNLARLQQTGTNAALINITGDFNNNSSLTTWGGAAASMLGAGAVGLMSQNGTGNALSMTVNGSHNLFATDQAGLDNEIVAMITGSGNQMGIVQSSTTLGNYANVTQNGTGNNAGVSQ